MIKNNIDLIIVSGSLFLLSFILLVPLFMLNDFCYHKYTYIDLNGELGHSNYCKSNYCDKDNKKISVKSFIDNRK